MKILKRLYRSIAQDYRCVDCDSQFIVWRSGEWVCPVHDLTPPCTQDETIFGKYVSDKGQVISMKFKEKDQPYVTLPHPL